MGLEEGSVVSGAVEGGCWWLLVVCLRRVEFLCLAMFSSPVDEVEVEVVVSAGSATVGSVVVVVSVVSGLSTAVGVKARICSCGDEAIGIPPPRGLVGSFGRELLRRRVVRFEWSGRWSLL